MSFQNRTFSLQKYLPIQAKCVFARTFYLCCSDKIHVFSRILTSDLYYFPEEISSTDGRNSRCYPLFSIFYVCQPVFVSSIYFLVSTSNYCSNILNFFIRLLVWIYFNLFSFSFIFLNCLLAWWIEERLVNRSRWNYGLDFL